MLYDSSLQRYRQWYGSLVRLYTKPYYERFGEGMEQTFNDVLREHLEKKRGVRFYIFWMFVDTLVGIIKQHITYTIMKKKITYLVFLTIGLLLIPLVMNILGNRVEGGNGWHWTAFDFVFMGVLIFGTGLAYLLISNRAKSMHYRLALGLALAGAFLLIWVNGAVGIIGSEKEDVNMLYFAVIAILFFGSIITNLKSKKMSVVLFITAAVQMLIPTLALLIWHPPFDPGVVPVFGINVVFAMIFIASGLLFKQVSNATNQPIRQYTK